MLLRTCINFCTRIMVYIYIATHYIHCRLKPVGKGLAMFVCVTYSIQPHAYQCRAVYVYGAMIIKELAGFYSLIN